MPFVTVHVNLLLPDTNPLTEVLAEAGTETLAVPVLDQLPLPIDGTRALNTALLLHTLWSPPALAVDGVLFVTFT
jgi:hypothetical protein